MVVVDTGPDDPKFKNIEQRSDCYTKIYDNSSSAESSFEEIEKNSDCKTKLHYKDPSTELSFDEIEIEKIEVVLGEFDKTTQTSQHQYSTESSAEEIEIAVGLKLNKSSSKFNRFDIKEK